MNRIDRLFAHKDKDVLSVYFTAGYPELSSTRKILRSLQEHGADMVEIGIPFSDPVADGPVIQESNSRALDNGMSLAEIFKQLRGLREEITMPLVLMGYMNPILMYGFEEFCADCKECGVDGVIIPDLPLDEYIKHYRLMFTNSGLFMIMLVTPMTTDDRIAELGKESGGFIYAVSDFSTTGGKNLAENRREYFARVSRISRKPVLVGFGVSDRESFLSACKVANGAITGSAFIKQLSRQGDIQVSIKNFLQEILSSPEVK